MLFRSLTALITSNADAIALVGKSWPLHVDRVLNTTPEENLSMIRDSVHAIKEKGKEVIYDAEHYFDGYKDNPDYALRTVSAAASSGADYICLCDTNGGSLPREISQIVRQTMQEVDTPLGIHAHNDSGLAVANTLAAVEEGVKMVQGTVNGYGERVGNANLCTVIPDLVLKLGRSCLKGGDKLKELSSLSRFVSELANMAPTKNAPFVGPNAFAHKGGLHVDAVLKKPETFEHVPPESVGNERRFLVSELSGKSTVKRKLENLGFDMEGREELLEQVLTDMKALEEEGYQFENADASFELLAKRINGDLPQYFQVQSYETKVYREGRDSPRAEANVKIKVQDRTREGNAEGDGPVNALDNAFRAALNSFFPPIQEMKLTDYKVRILESHRGTAAKPRVSIEMTEGKKTWNTIGVSSNIIQASWDALRDAYIYGLELKSKVGGEIGTSSDFSDG